MGDVDEETEALAEQEEAAVPTEEPDPFGIGVVDDEAEALAREEEKASEVLQLSNDDFEQRLDDAIDAFHENPKIRPAEEFLDVQPTAEQMKMLEMNALTLAASEDSLSATALLGETMEEGVTQLNDIPRWYQRAARNVKRLWNKMFGRSPDYAFDTEQVAMEMQNMGSNDLKEALLDSLEDTHIQGTHIDPKPDGSYQPPDEFGLGDDGILEAPPAMAGEAENMGTIVDQLVDAGLDAAINVVDTAVETGSEVVKGALSQIPGFDAITSAVARGAGSMNPSEFVQNFADDLEFVPSASGWTLASTTAKAANIVGALAGMGGLAVAGSVATDYMNKWLPGSGDMVNWTVAAALAGAGSGPLDALPLLISGATAMFDTVNEARARPCSWTTPTVTLARSSARFA